MSTPLLKLNPLKIAEAKEIYKQTKTGPTDYDSITAEYPLQQVQMDLMVMDKVKNKDNRGYAYGLVMIDIYSRYAEIIPIKYKTADEVLEAFRKINIRPEIIRSDNGSEFTNNKFQDYLIKKDIKHYTNEIGDHRYLGIVDRFIRTIRDHLRIIWEVNNSFNWVDYIDAVVDNYNNTKHTTTKNKPFDILNGTADNEQIINRSKLIHKFPVGSKVRKLLKKDIFDKGGKQWSKKIFEVKERSGYKLILDDGSKISPRELLKTEMANPEVIQEDSKEKLKAITKEKTTQQLLKREDIAPENIRRSARERKAKVIYDV